MKFKYLIQKRRRFGKTIVIDFSLRQTRSINLLPLLGIDMIRNVQFDINIGWLFWKIQYYMYHDYGDCCSCDSSN